MGMKNIGHLLFPASFSLLVIGLGTGNGQAQKKYNLPLKSQEQGTEQLQTFVKSLPELSQQHDLSTNAVIDDKTPCGFSVNQQKPYLQKICDWIGYSPIRTGSTIGYPRPWKRRPDLYLYFRDCREVVIPAQVCESCQNSSPKISSLSGMDSLPDSLPQQDFSGGTKP